MSTGLVDWVALGLPKLEYIFGPTPVISTVLSERTAYETYFVNEALYQAQRVVDNPNDFGLIGPHGQYGGHRIFYRLYYSTQQMYPQLLTAGNRLIEVFRDGLLGHPPEWWDVTIMQGWIEGNDSLGNQIINPYQNPNAEGWAAFSLINPALEAAAVRKTADIVKFYAAASYRFNATQSRAGDRGARETGVATRWSHMFSILWGPTATVNMIDSVTFALRPFTAAEMLEDCLVHSVINMAIPLGGRPYFGWDGDAPPPGSNLYIGNNNLAGSNSQGLVRYDRHRKKLGTPDTRIYPEIKKHFDWIDFGTAPGIGTITSNPGSAIQTGGSQWIPGVGNYTPTRWRGSVRYYYYHNPDNYNRPNNNGVHPETETVNTGHLLSTFAWGYAQETDSVAKARYRSRVNDSIDGMIRWATDFWGAHFGDPRNWTEFSETFQETFGILAEADGEPIIPPPGDMVVTPLNPAVNATITVTITNGPGTLGDWVALAPVGAPLDTYLPTWKYLATNSQAFPSTTPTSGVVTIQAPPTTGTFEMRFLRNDLFELAPGFTPVLVVVGGGGSGFEATIARTGLPDELYTVTVQTSPADEYRVQWFVNDAPYPPVLSGPLTKGVSQRYFKDANGRGRILTGSHNWNNVSEWGSPPTTPGNPPSAFDWSAHLLTLVNEGHTATRLWLLGDFVNYNETAATPGPAYRTFFPWARSSTPGAINGGNKYDLNVFDATYFARLRSRVLEATDAGITCIILFFNGFDDQFNLSKNIWHASENTTVNGDVNANGRTEEVYNLAQVPPALLNIQKAYVHHVVDTLNDIDGVIWELTNESGGFSQTWLEHMIADLRAYEASKPKQHPIMQGFMYQGGTNAQLWNLNVDAVAPGTVASGGASPDGTGDYFTDPPASSGAKVVIGDTDHVYGEGGDETDVWRNFCRALQTIYMDSMSAAAQNQRARAAMGQTALMAQRLRTDLNQFSVQAQGTATPCNTGYCLYMAGDIAEAIIYRPSGGPNPVTMNLSSVAPGVTVSYVWEHPFTRVVGGSGTVLGGAVRSFVPPDGNDWVLFLRRLDLPYSLFGLTGATPTAGNLGVGTFVVRADIYEVTGESLLGTRELTIVNVPPNGLITWPTPGYVFRPASPIHTPQDYLILQPQGSGIDGVQFRIRPAAGGSTLNVGTEITVPQADGTFRHDPFVHTVYVDGAYLIDAVVRAGVTTSVCPSVGVTINNTGGGAGTRQGRRLRGRLP